MPAYTCRCNCGGPKEVDIPFGSGAKWWLGYRAGRSDNFEGGAMTRFVGLSELFEGRHFDPEIIILCVRWYPRFEFSFRNLVEPVRGTAPGCAVGQHDSVSGMRAARGRRHPHDRQPPRRPRGPSSECWESATPGTDPAWSQGRRGPSRGARFARIRRPGSPSQRHPSADKGFPMIAIRFL